MSRFSTTQRDVTTVVPTRAAATRTGEASSGLTPSELARALDGTPKRIRDILRAQHGTLPRAGDRWGGLTSEQESHVRARLRRGSVEFSTEGD